MSPLSVCVVFGTRPEAIKLMPVVQELRRRSEQFDSHVVATAQHRELLDLAIDDFGVMPDVDLDLMCPGQTPADFMSFALRALPAVFEQQSPDWVIVQGDTTTTLAGALAAYWHGASICHVEAGLRTGNRRSPFPEEMHRRLVGQLADLHCAPTARARAALLAEGIEADHIVVTGNTVVDAVRWIVAQSRPPVDCFPAAPCEAGPLVIVTVHRRENFGRPLEEIVEGVRCLAAVRRDASILWPVHPNPSVSEVVWDGLRGQPNVALVPPLSYRRFVQALQRAQLVVTDSGGIQEEVAVLGKPTLVLRRNTERPESVESGWTELVEPDAELIAQRAVEVLNAGADERLIGGTDVYGQGDAAVKIVDALTQFVDRKRAVRAVPIPVQV